MLKSFEKQNWLAVNENNFEYNFSLIYLHRFCLKNVLTVAFLLRIAKVLCSFVKAAKAINKRQLEIGSSASEKITFGGKNIKCKMNLTPQSVGDTEKPQQLGMQLIGIKGLQFRLITISFS